MLRTLSKWWRPERVVYRPEVAALGLANEAEYEGLLPQLAKGYENAPHVFKAILVLLRKLEEEAFAPRDPQDPAAWAERQRALVDQINILRKVVRLPVEAAGILKSRAKREERREQFEKAFEAV